MKREEIVHIAITKDEMTGISKKMAEKMLEDGKHMTVSSFLREFAIKPLLTDNSSPPQETPQDTEPVPTEKNPYDDINF